MASVKSTQRGFKRYKKALIITGVLFVFLLLILYLFFAKIRPVIMAVNIYKHAGHAVFEYHVDFNTLDNDEEEGFIKALGKGNDGFAIVDRDGKEYKGSFYNGDNYDPYISFYKDSENVYISLKDITSYMVGIIDKDKDTHMYEHINGMEDYYITVSQLKEFFGITVNEIKIDWGAIIKKAVKFKPCDPPKDYHTSIDVTGYDFYHFDMEGEDKEVVFGIPKGFSCKNNVVYISVTSKTMRFEMYGYYEFRDEVDVNRPDSTVDEEKLEKLKGKFDFIKDILELLH